MWKVCLAALLVACGTTHPDPPEPALVAQLPIDKTIHQMTISGNTAFAEHIGETVPDVLYAIDLSVPTSPQLSSVQNIDGIGGKLLANGPRLFMASGLVFDVADPTQPSMMAMISGWSGMALYGGNYV